MKKSKLFLFGMIAALVAGSLFMTGCEQPQGSTTNNYYNVDERQKAELAEFGYTFGDPTHVQYGRGAVYGAEIVGSIPLPTAGAYTVDSTTPVSIEYNKKSVTFWPKASYPDTAAVLSDFNAVLSAGGLAAEVEASIISLSATDKRFKLAVKGTPTGQLLIEQSNSASSVFANLFDGSSTNSLLSTEAIASPLPDTWEYPIVNANIGVDTTSVHSKVVVGNVSIPVAAGTALADVATQVQAEIEDHEDKVTKLLAYTNYEVTAGTESLIITARLNDDATGFLTGFDPVAQRPSITKNDDSYLSAYGYTLLLKHMELGAPLATPTPSVTPSTGIATANPVVAATASTAASGYGDTLTVAFDGKQDVIVFPNSVANLSTRINAGPLPQTGVTVATSGNITFTTVQTGTQPGSTKTVTVSGTGAVVGSSGIIPNTISATGIEGRAEETTEGEDKWQIRLIGSGDSISLSPTVGSIVTIQGNLTIIPANTVNTAHELIDLLHAGTTITNYTVNDDDVSLVTIEKGSTGSTNNITVAAPTIAGL
ncbi:hypothetical protein FACS189494_10850 [Spirochaetia bacterium]|nr:hypothetical protein FACS189494_10850 [Spirochaetia bacterium]